MAATGPRTALVSAPASVEPLPRSVVPGSELLKGLFGVRVAASDSRLGEGALRGPGDGGGAVDGGSDSHAADLGCGAHEGHVVSIGLAGAAGMDIEIRARAGRCGGGRWVGGRGSVVTVRRPFQFLHQPSAKRAWEAPH
jgi:hypothetical protein